MPDPIVPKRYDPDVAAMMSSADERLTGLPAYLGIRTVDVGPARMAAELDVRPGLLNPFGSAHGGVLRAAATIVSMTRRTAVAQIEVFNEGRLAALAQGRVLVPEARPPAP
jgi:acyl-coenzyme A thioesterase PaaI-like protein